MNCPRCRLDLTAATSAFCPRCGEPLPAQPPIYQEYAGYQGYPTYPTGPADAYGNPAPPSAPLYGPPPGGAAYPPYPTGTYAPPSSPMYAPPIGGESGYPHTPSGPGASPSSYGAYGAYGAGAQPSTPMYQPGASPYYGQGAPPSVPMYPPSGGVWPGYAPPARPKSKMPVIAGVALVLVLVLAAVAGVALVGHGAPSSGSNAAVSGSATATPYDNVVFTDPLTSNANGWSDSAYCHFGPGGYHVSNRICYAPTDSFADVVISVQTSQVSGPITRFYGLVLRRKSAGNYYSFQIDSNGKWRFFKVVGGNATDIQPYIPNAAIHHGLHANNLLKVRAIGSHFEFFVNGVQVGQADDSTFGSGYCGFEVSDQIEVIFSNLVIAIPV